MPLFRRGFLPFLAVLALPLQPAAGQAAPAAQQAPQPTAVSPATDASDWLYRGSDLPRDPAWQMGRLDNGVRYAVRRNPLPAGQVSIRIRIDAGALNEAPHEQGWAHFLEHMVFRGTKSFGDREARNIWQKLGARFGSDTNAATTPTQTIYQLDLPHADRAALDTSLKILAEMMDSALIAPATVEAERKVILAEKDRRPELATRLNDVLRPLFYAGLTFAERDTIGTDETLAAASSEGLRAFYERWYRPDRATVVIVGDADPAMLVELITRHFEDWKASGPPPEEPDDGRITDPPSRVAALAYPGAPTGASLMWLRPHNDGPSTVARNRDELAEQLAARIINRRLSARARADAPFTDASLSIGRERRIADSTQLSITPREGRWREALVEAFAILADALRAPPSAAEIERELKNSRTAINSAVAGESTIRSNQWAQRFVSAVDGHQVMIGAANMQALFDQLAPEMTPERIGAATKSLFSGSGPRMLLLTPEPVEGAPDSLAAALAAAEKAAPATRQADRTVSFDSLPPLGPPGKVASRQHIEDLDVTIIRFENGSTLTYKQTDFEKGSVLVKLRFGGGTASLPATEPTPVWMSSVVAPSGLADLDLDAMERLLTGRRINLNFGVEEDAFNLTGVTNDEDLPDQLRLLVSKLLVPRWDAQLFNRYKANWLDNYRLSFGSAASRAGREFGSVVHPDDKRWLPIERERIAEAKPEDASTFFTPILAARPVDAIIVGNFDPENAVKAAARTIGALPPAPPDTRPVSDSRPPQPDPEPKRFTHEGDPNQAYAAIGWSTFGGTGQIRERRALAVAASILQTRLFDRLREEEGATYAPAASAVSSGTFPSWGIFYVAAAVRPQHVDTFFRIAREEVARLAAAPVPQEEFDRARNPIISGIERGLKTNGYWFSAIESWTTKPELIEQTRSHLSDYRDMTAERVRAAVAAYVADEGDWSMLVLPEKAKADGK